MTDTEENGETSPPKSILVKDGSPRKRGSVVRFSVVAEEVEFMLQSPANSDSSKTSSPSDSPNSFLPSRGGDRGIESIAEEAGSDSSSSCGSGSDERRASSEEILDAMQALRRSVMPQLNRLESIVQDLASARAQAAWARNGIINGLSSARDKGEQLRSEMHRLAKADREEDALNKLLDTLKGMSHQELVRAFHAMDTNGSGTLDKKEVEAAGKDLGLEIEPLQLIMFMKTFDTNRNGVICINEFLSTVQAMAAADEMAMLQAKVTLAECEQRAVLAEMELRCTRSELELRALRAEQELSAARCR